MDAYIKCDHDKDIYEYAITIIMSNNKLYNEQESIYTHVIRKRMVDHIFNLVRNRLQKIDYLTITRWFYTQILLPPISKIDPIIPDNDIKNIGLTYELRKFGLSNNVIQDVENLMIQLCKSFDKNKFSYSKLKVEMTKSIYKFTFEDISFVLSQYYYNKLTNLYKKFTCDNEQKLNEIIFNMLCRYDTLNAPGYHAALPKAVFDILKIHLKVSHEIFASPLNCTLDSYNSAYYDTDKYFGSKGSFFSTYDDILKDGGSFEANPPFLEEHMAIFAIIAKQYLDKDIPLSFIIIMPEWIDTVAYYMFMESKYNVLSNKRLIFKRHEHYYQNANLNDIRKFKKPANNNTLVFFLQNELGSTKYHITDNFINNLSYEFKNRNNV